MKKLCAGILCVLLCLTALPLAGAEEGDSTGTGTATATATATGTGTGTSTGTGTRPASKKELTIRVSVTDGMVSASVQDEDGAVPAGLSFTLTVDGEEVETQEIQENGRVVFDYILEAGDERIVVSTEGSDEYEAASGQTTVEYTPEEILGFEFEETSRNYNGESGSFSMEWNYNDPGNTKGARITAMIVAGETYSVRSSLFNRGRITATLPNDIPYGRSSLSYVFQVEGEEVVLPAEDLVRTGTTSVTIELSIEGGRIRAAVTDSMGNPVPGLPLTLTVGSTTLPAQETGEDGTVTFTGVSSPAAGTQVRCDAAEMTTADGVTYLAATASLTVTEDPGSASPSTTTGSGSTSVETPPPVTTRRRTNATTKKNETTTTARTYETIRGAGTTSVEDDNIVVNVTFDEGVVGQFGLNNSDFEGRARFLIPQETYAELMSGNNGTLMLTARYSPIQVTDQQISAAISNLSKYSLYHAESIERVTLNLALLFTGQDGTEMEVTSLPEAQYVVQLPVPASMQNVGLVAVAATSEESIATPVEVQVEDGYLRFTTRYLSTFTILGFTEADSSTISKTPTVALVLIIVGVLLLAGACLLMYFFVFRKPGDNGTQPPETGPGPDGGAPLSGGGPAGPDTMEDIYSSASREPIPIVPPSRPDMEDIYSSESRRPRPPAPPAPPVSSASPTPSASPFSARTDAQARQTPPSQGVSLGSFKSKKNLPVDLDEDDGL